MSLLVEGFGGYLIDMRASALHDCSLVCRIVMADDGSSSRR